MLCYFKDVMAIPDEIHMASNSIFFLYLKLVMKVVKDSKKEGGKINCEGCDTIKLKKFGHDIK